MAPLKIKIVLFFFSTFSFSQIVENKTVNNDTIYFKYNKTTYNKIALDSISSLYHKQYDRYYNGDIFPNIKERAISLNYKLEDLYYYAIPKFRLYKDASEEFNCDSSIEEFISFEEYNKYQFTLIRYKDKILNKIPIPNPIFERERIENPRFRKYIDSSAYEREYIQTLVAYPENHTDYYNKLIYNKYNNFFFEIYGLFEVLFEIETKTGLLYANYYGDMIDVGGNRRVLANEFIRKYIGEKKIKILASGKYEEIDLEDIELPIPCENSVNKRNVYLKVNRVN